MIVLTKIAEDIKNFYLNYKDDPTYLAKAEFVLQDLKKVYKKTTKSKKNLEQFDNIVKNLERKSKLKNIDLKKP